MRVPMPYGWQVEPTQRKSSKESSRSVSCPVCVQLGQSGLEALGHNSRVGAAPTVGVAAVRGQRLRGTGCRPKRLGQCDQALAVCVLHLVQLPGLPPTADLEAPPKGGEANNRQTDEVRHHGHKVVN